MEDGVVGIHKEEGEKWYDIYVEEYVLSYLKRESDSLELSEIYFYGQREDDGRKIFVYGAGREKGISVFAKYELLTELVCRLTQAGPVFMVCEEDGTCKAAGFQVFYENNEAMQNFLIEWTGSEGKQRAAKGKDGQKTTAFPAAAAQKVKKHMVHGAISVQLCLILVVLAAIVISSTDSYDKMEQLGQSAKEVFFAIENQETEKSAKDLGEQTEIVVERDVAAEGHEEGAGPVAAKSVDRQQDTGFSEKDTPGLEEEPEEGILEPAKDQAEAAPEQHQAAQNDGKAEENSEAAENSADSAEEQEAEKGEDTQDVETLSDEENKEALSRSITRYYEVKRGDTLYTISQEIYGDISRVGKICEINQISDPDKIRYGQKIILP